MAHSHKFHGILADKTAGRCRWVSHPENSIYPQEITRFAASQYASNRLIYLNNLM
jgi:hypothetical protein